MLSRTFLQIFILAYAPRLLWASLIPKTPTAASEGAQMRNKHAPPSSKQKDHKALLDSWHTQTLVQAHKRAVEVDHHGSAKKLGHKKAVRTTHSTHDVTEKASAHASGFAEDVSGSKNVDGIHANSRAHIRKLHKNKKTSRVDHSTQDVTETASGHTGGFTEGASVSKDVNGIHAGSGAHIRKLHKMAVPVGDHGFHGHGHHHAHGHHHGHGHHPHHHPKNCRKTNAEIFIKSGWEEHEDCNNRHNIQTWLEQNEIEVTGIKSFESFARLKTLTECSELCEKHTGVPSVADSGSGSSSVGTSAASPGNSNANAVVNSMAQAHPPPHDEQHQKRKHGGKRCVAIAHTRAEKGDGTCYLFSDRGWPSELQLKVDAKVANGLGDTSTQALGGEAIECGPWKCFLFKGESDSIAPH